MLLVLTKLQPLIFLPKQLKKKKTTWPQPIFVCLLWHPFYKSGNAVYCFYSRWPKIPYTKVSHKTAYRNSAYLNQTAAKGGAVWSGSTLSVH